jgi:hypothetical protein
MLGSSLQNFSNVHELFLTLATKAIIILAFKSPLIGLSQTIHELHHFLAFNLAFQNAKPRR